MKPVCFWSAALILASTAVLPAGFPAQQNHQVIQTSKEQPRIVRIDAFVAEVDFNDTERSLFCLLGDGQHSPKSSSDGFAFAVSSDKISLVIRELQMKHRLEVISAPSVTVYEGAATTIRIGQHIYYSGTMSTTMEDLTHGVEFRLTPTINPDGAVAVRVVPQLKSADQSKVEFADGVTAFHLQTLDTAVTCKDGETGVLGGPTEEREVTTEHKLPWIGEIPWAGDALTYSTHEKQKGQLLLFATPHVYRPAHAGLAPPRS